MILKVLQWNAHKSLGPAGVSELNTILINENIPIVLLQEMGMKDTKPKFPEREWNIYGSGNAGILVHKNLRSIFLPEFSITTEAFSTAAATIYPDGQTVPINFISVYRNILISENSSNSQNSQNSNLADPNIFLDWLENTIAELPANSESFVIGGDFNIRAKEFGSHKDDNGAARLVTLGLSLNPEGCILNDGSITRQHWITSDKNIQPSAIDITMVYASVSSGIVFTDWKTNGTGISDHMRITFDINFTLNNRDEQSDENEMKTNQRIYKKNVFNDEQSESKSRADFSNLLSNKIISKGWVPTNDTQINNVPNVDPDITISEMNEMIIQSAISSQMIKLAVPLRKFPLSKTRNYAWDQTCDEKLRERRTCARSLAKAKKSYVAIVEEIRRGKKRNHLGEVIANVDPSKENKKLELLNNFTQTKTLYNKSILMLRKAIKSARQNSWNKAIESIQSDTPIKTLWESVNKIGRRVTKRSSHRRPFLVKEGNGTIHSNPKQQANCLAQYWEGVSKNFHSSYEQSHFDIISSKMKSMRNSISPLVPQTRREAAQILLELPKNADSKWQARLTMAELKNALSTINTKSNPGEDSITYEMIKYAGEIFQTFLLNLYNYCWATGIYPESWKRGIVIALPKQKDAINVNEFRPITLLSCVGKIFEKIVGERLKFFLERSGILCNSQFGFRTKRSTTEQLTRIVQDIHNGWEQGMDTIFVSFDVKKAFDSMWHDGLLYKLHEMGIRGRMLRLIASYLQSRHYKVTVEGQLSNECSTTSGVPQGGVLSPLLFIIFNNDSLEGIPSSIKGSLFADDTAIFCHVPRENGPLRKLRLEQLQLAINKIMEWSSKWRLQQGKAKCMVFHQKGTVNSRDGPDAPSFKINDMTISPLKSSPLRFLGLFMDPKLDFGWHIDIIVCRARTRLNVLKGFASKTHGSDQATLRHLYLAWVRPLIEYAPTVLATATTKNLLKLDKFQYDALRLITSGSATVSARAMHVEARVEPVSQRHILAAGRQMAKILRKPADDILLAEWRQWLAKLGHWLV